MKIKTEKAPKIFEPIKMTITFESEEELKALWNRMNLNTRSFEGAYLAFGGEGYDFDSKVDGSVKRLIWKEYTELLKQL